MAFDDVFSIDNFQNDIIDSSINEDFSMNGGCNHYCGDVDDAQDCWNNCGDDDDDSCDCDCD